MNKAAAGNAGRSKLSELEAVVIGLVWSEGPCTAYAVRRIVQKSLSTQWSGSAGAVYPAVQRLERRGWIRAEATLRGRRPAMQLSITAAGRAALRSWLGPPLDAAAAGLPVDPLRTRLRFLEILSPTRRLGFIQQVRAKLTDDLQSVEADYQLSLQQESSPFRRAMVRGAMKMAQARLAMIEELIADLEG